MIVSASTGLSSSGLLKLIADSGSTNCLWVLASGGNELQRIITSGINPFYLSQEEIETILQRDLLPRLQSMDIAEIHFYSAGCAFPDKIAIVRQALSSQLYAPVIEVHTDLLAVARAACGNEAGIACILGTGSNTCLYDGEKIVKNVSPLGFILGDEGSGASIGKLFIGNLLKNQYPESLYDTFMESYHTSPSEIMENVYRKPFPNRYLAQFTHFIAGRLDEPLLYKLVFNSLMSFINRNVKQYDYQSYPVYFSGSVAWYFADILQEVCMENGIYPADIQQSPMQGLVEYHE